MKKITVRFKVAKVSDETIVQLVKTASDAGADLIEVVIK